MNGSTNGRAAIAAAGHAMQSGRPLEAENILRDYITRAGRDAAGYAALSDLLLNAKRFSDVIEICERGLKVAASDKALQNNLVLALVGADRLDQAITRLQRMIESTPRFALAHAYLGSIHAKRGELDGAVTAFRNATSLNPRDSVSLIALGECELIARQPTAALDALNRGLAISPHDIRGLALKTLALAALGHVADERALADPSRLVHRHSPAALGCDSATIERLTHSLSAFARDEPSLREDPPQHATNKAWHSTVNLADARNPAVDELKSLVRCAFEQRVASLRDEVPDHPFVRSAPPAYHLDLWAIRMQEGGQLYPHIHADGWLSGVYYVDVPAIVNDRAANRAGWIEFGHPRNDIVLAHSPTIHAVKPEPGMLITFPSYIWHATVPLPPANDERRLCLAFDLHPRAA